MTGHDIVVDVEDLRMHYGRRQVLHAVTFQCRRGEVVALLGPNGAGKTTTVEILEGFRTRSGGRVEVLGTDPARATEEWRAGVGIVLQSWRDHGRWRVGELLRHLGACYARHGRAWNTETLTTLVGLSDVADRPIRTLSGGQRRRLDVALGIVGRPDLLFLDEPTAGFDPQARVDFHRLIGQLAREHATTVLLTTHDLAEAESIADRVMILAGGRILAQGTVDELAQQIVGADEVRWACDGQHYTHATSESTRFVHGLFQRHGTAITDLEVRRSSLADTYVALVAQAEVAQAEVAQAEVAQAEEVAA
jgi:ABC-2 type transport system ATP-binding protein